MLGRGLVRRRGVPTAARVPSRSVLAATDEEDDEGQEHEHTGDHGRALHPPRRRRSSSRSCCFPFGHPASFSRQCVEVKTCCLTTTTMPAVPKVWTDTVEAHRQHVIDAVLDSAAALVAETGLTEVSMSGVAERSGIARATLYRYFPTLDAVLVAWHQREVDRHLAELEVAGSEAGTPVEGLRAVLTAYAHRVAQSHHGGMAAALHRTEHVEVGHARLEVFVTGLVTEAADEGALRRDVAPRELALYAIHALGAAGTLGSKAAVGRLIEVTLDGLRAT